MTATEINYNQYLRSNMEIMATLRKDMPLPDGFFYSCSEDIVLKFGKEFIPSPLKEPYKKDIPKQCFFNSYKLASLFKNLIYIEGFGLINELPFPIHHAWCVDIRDPLKVIDVTSEFKSYIGIPFKRSVLRMKWKTGSLLDDWMDGWRLLRTSPEDVKKKYLYYKNK